MPVRVVDVPTSTVVLASMKTHMMYLLKVQLQVSHVLWIENLTGSFLLHRALSLYL